MCEINDPLATTSVYSRRISLQINEWKKECDCRMYEAMNNKTLRTRGRPRTRLHLIFQLGTAIDHRYVYANRRECKGH